MHMKTNSLYRNLLIFLLLILNVGCDQVSKHIVRKNIDYHERIAMLGDRLTLTKVENSGAFLSAGVSLSAPLKIVLLTVVPVAVLLLGLVYVLRKKELSLLTVTGICFAIGGGLGNIYDRIRYGSVTDFLHIDFGIFQTGVFNAADMSVMMGVFLILIEAWRERRIQHKNQSPGA